MNYQIPPVNLPDPAILSNLHTKDLKTASDEWISSYGIADLEYDHVLFACLIYPLTRSALRMRWLSDFFQWEFVFDDLLDNPSRHGANPPAVSRMTTDMRAVVRGGRGPWTDPYLAAFADLWQRITPDLSPAQTDRLAGYFVDYGDALDFMAAQRFKGRVPSVAEFAPQRRKESIMYVCMTLMDYSLEQDAAAILDELDEFQRVYADYCIVTQDLLSYRKEAAVGDELNYIDTFRHEHNCSLQDAVDVTSALEGDLKARYKTLLTEHAGLLGPFTDAYRYFVSGYLKWTLQVGRY